MLVNVDGLEYLVDDVLCVDLPLLHHLLLPPPLLLERAASEEASVGAAVAEVPESKVIELRSTLFSTESRDAISGFSCIGIRRASDWLSQMQHEAEDGGPRRVSAEASSGNPDLLSSCNR